MKKSLMALTVLSAAAIVAAPAMAANTLTVPGGSPGQGLGGTSYLLSINVDQAAGNSVFVQSDHPNDETHLLIRFRLKFNELHTVATGSGRSFRLLNIGDDTATSTPHKILFLQRQTTTGNWRLTAWTYTNGGIYEFVGAFFLGNYLGGNERQIECEWTKATAGANGVFGCFRTDAPGTQTFQRTNINDGNFQGDYVQAGLFDFDNFPGSDATVGNNLKFDEYESYR